MVSVLVDAAACWCLLCLSGGFRFMLVWCLIVLIMLVLLVMSICCMLVEVWIVAIWCYVGWTLFTLFPYASALMLVGLQFLGVLLLRLLLVVV